MYGVLKLEWIGDHYFHYNERAVHRNHVMERQIHVRGMAREEFKPWVARITGVGKQGKLMREFVRGVRDYSEANSIGSRGIYEYFTLPPGVYEVNNRVSWSRVRRYFVRVSEEGDITEISKQEVLSWLGNDF